MLGIGIGGGIRRACGKSSFAVAASVVASASLASPLAAQATASPPPPSRSVLFAAQVRGGTLAPKGDGGYALTLTGVPRQVVGFSDRPRRYAFAMPATRFFGSFWRRANPTPPLVALDLRDDDNRRDTLILRVRHPRLRGTTLTLDARTSSAASSDLDHYDAQRLDRTPPRRFGSASLFLDTQPRDGRSERAPRKRVPVDLVFVTGAESGTLELGPKRKGRAKYQLTLRGVRDHVMAFSDSPVDLTYNVGSRRFFGRWWRNLFSDSSPNAALDFLARSKGESVALELSNPRLKGSTLRLDARRLGRTSNGFAPGTRRAAEPLPRRFDDLSLFVDSAIGNPPNTSDCRFDIRNRTGPLFYASSEVEGSGFRWDRPSGYSVPAEGVPGPTFNGGTVTGETGARWEGEATQPFFGSLGRCSAKVTMNDSFGPLYTMRVTEYMLVADRHLSSAAECIPLRRYWSCEKSEGSKYYRECFYPTEGQTDAAYCTEEWITTGSFTVCDEAPAFPPRHTCPSWRPPHDPTDDEPLARRAP